MSDKYIDWTIEELNEKLVKFQNYRVIAEKINSLKSMERIEREILKIKDRIDLRLSVLEFSDE
jgi:cell fate (sporulation/competence/biofilm development) regulator YmcA (YheA/YmcA/DUF963 family)